VFGETPQKNNFFWKLDFFPALGERGGGGGVCTLSGTR